MVRKYMLAVVFMTAGFVCSQVLAQSSYTFYDSNTAAPHVFTNTVGTASTNGTLVVFEGELESLISVPKAYNLTSDRYLASVQLLTQIRLFDELPTSNEVGSVQGAVAALRNSVGSSNGTYYVWAVTNGGLTGWTQLQTTNAPPTAFAVNDGETNYVTFVFSYPPNVPSVRYQVYIGNETDSVMVPSLQVTSPTTETNGINSVSMLGVGGVMEVGTASGSPSPLSTAVDFSVYATTNGVRIEINTVNEEGEGLITVYALINGVWTPVGTIQAKGYGSNKYYLYATGLEVGKSYWFKIVDEANHTHTSTAAIEIKEIKMEAVAMMLDALRVTFNTESGRKYLVKVSTDMAAPLDQWTTEYVRVYNAVSGEWSEYANTPFMAGPGLQTVIEVPLSKQKAFFKIILVDEP